MSYPKERAYYRISYPGHDCPWFLQGDEVLAIVDCSEAGLRYMLPDGAAPPEIGTEIQGLVRFRDGAEVEVEGTVVRIQGRTAALVLTKRGIPFAEILAEQRYFRLHYLRHLQDDG